MAGFFRNMSKSMASSKFAPVARAANKISAANRNSGGATVSATPSRLKRSAKRD